MMLDGRPASGAPVLLFACMSCVVGPGVEQDASAPSSVIE
jgi:hypothetical protein